MHSTSLASKMMQGAQKQVEKESPPLFVLDLDAGDHLELRGSKNQSFSLTPAM